MDTVENFASEALRLARRATKTPLFGKNARMKPFFLDHEADEDNPVYNELPPLDLPNPKQDKYDQEAVLGFFDKKKVPLLGIGSGPTLRITHIKIQSHFLRNELRPFLEPYNVEYDDDCPVLYSPFKELYFCREHLERKQQKLPEDSEERQHISVLIDVILNGDEMAHLKAEVEILEAEHQMTWEYAWTMFPSDSIVVAKTEQGHEQAYQVMGTRVVDADKPFLSVLCQYIHFDGHQFGFLQTSIPISWFAGKKRINELAAYPLRLARRGDPSKGEALKKQFHERGKKLLDYQGVHYVQVNAAAYDPQRANFDELMRDHLLEDSHGRAIVDFYTAAKRNEQWKYSVRSLYEFTWPLKAPDSKGKGKDTDLYGVEDDFQATPASQSKPAWESSARPDLQAQEYNKQLMELEEDNLVLMSPLLHAFSLETKQWISVNVDFVKNMERNEEINRHIVIDNRKRDMLCNLVENQHKIPQGLGDPVAHKDGGLIVLFSGPPGTGKTLLAEAVAERTMKPLYTVDARDLGTDPETIARRFKRIMQDAAQWNAIILLNEADTYLHGGHSSSGLQREAVFLQQLEYFNGTLFLTSSRSDEMSSAIKSRIHIHQKFSKLTRHARAEIWSRFLEKLTKSGREHKLSESDIQELATWDLNGRQIKNAFRMTLGAQRGAYTPITRQDLETMIPDSCPESSKKSYEYSKDDLISMDEPAASRHHLNEYRAKRQRAPDSSSKTEAADLLGLIPPIESSSVTQLEGMMLTDGTSTKSEAGSGMTLVSSRPVDLLQDLDWPPCTTVAPLVPELRTSQTSSSLEDRFNTLRGRAVPSNSGDYPSGDLLSEIGTESTSDHAPEDPAAQDFDFDDSLNTIDSEGWDETLQQGINSSSTSITTPIHDEAPVPVSVSPPAQLEESPKAKKSPPPVRPKPRSLQSVPVSKA